MNEKYNDYYHQYAYYDSSAFSKMPMNQNGYYDLESVYDIWITKYQSKTKPQAKKQRAEIKFNPLLLLVA